MIKKIAVSVCLLLTLANFAQEGTASPYSFYGIGDVKFKGTAENRAMGGLSIFPDSIHLNIQNPASFAGLKYTTLSIGGSLSTTNLETETQTGEASRSTIDYFAVGLPMGDFGVAFGLLPYSSVGYKIEAEGNVGGVPSERKFSGSGGINRVFLGLGYKINNAFSIGADVSYNFGHIETSSLYDVGAQFASRELNASDIGGVNFSAGLLYETKINEKLRFFSGLSYSTQGNLRSENERKIATVQLFETGGQLVIDEEDINVDDTTLKIPSRFTFGAGLGQTQKWMVGAEVSLAESNDQGNRFNDIDNVEFENGMRFSVGGFYLPKYNSFTSYLSRITYRAGVKHENTGLVINDKSIFDTNVNVGVGLPLGGSLSNINIGFEYGKRGTVYGGLVRENYANIIIGLSFNDKWFVKRKYD